jgi:hypothetical protein
MRENTRSAFDTPFPAEKRKISMPLAPVRPFPRMALQSFQERTAAGNNKKSKGREDKKTRTASNKRGKPPETPGN